MAATETWTFQMERLGLVLQADPSRPEEIEGVLNPAAARGPDGELYLFPRLVGAGNYSRIGIARVRFNYVGNPCRAERLGVALEPTEAYELRPEMGGGGCEDARVTYVEPLQRYVMAYTAWGSAGPRVALAESADLLSWRRLGLVMFSPRTDAVYGVDFDAYHNKDAAFFPDVVTAPDGRPALAMLHRPVYDEYDLPKNIADPRPSIWISYVPLDEARRDIRCLTAPRQHRVLIHPEQPWETLRIGAGTPPVRTRFGWLLLYHGVAGRIARVPPHRQPVEYAAGVLVLDEHDPLRVRYRSARPILRPETGEETEGVVPHVVFPTGIDGRGDDRWDVYYGMADLRIGALRLRLAGARDADGR